MVDDKSDPIRVIYVVGCGRSGTTVIDRIIGSVPRAQSMNELVRFFPDGIRDGHRCTCRQQFQDCPYWRTVRESVFDCESHAAEIYRQYDAFDHTRRLPMLIAMRQLGKRNRKLDAYLDWLRHFYRTISGLADGKVIVDSSKVPSRLFLLSMLSDIDLHVVHVVRDVRAVVASWRRARYNPASEGELGSHSTTRIVLDWYARNVMAEKVSRGLSYQRIRYEDVMLAPRESVPDLIKKIEPLRDQRVEFDDQDRLLFDVCHSIGGNPDRFAGGWTKLELDQRWQEELEPKLRKRVDLSAYPMLRRYGYL